VVGGGWGSLLGKKALVICKIIMLPVHIGIMRWLAKEKFLRDG